MQGKKKLKASTNPMYISTYILLFPRTSYTLLALYLFTEAVEDSDFLSLMNALPLYFFPGLSVIFSSFFRRKQV